MEFDRETNLKRIEKIDELLIRLSDFKMEVHFDHLLNELMNNYINSLNDQIPNQIKINFQLSENNDDFLKSLFPKIELNNKTTREIVQNIYKLKKEVGIVVQLQEEYIPMLQNIKNNLIYINDNSRNRFFSIFQDKDTKKQLNISREYVALNYFQLEVLENKITDFILNSGNDSLVLKDYTENKIDYHKFIAEKLNIKTDIPDYLYNLLKTKSDNLIEKINRYSEDILKNEINDELNLIIEEQSTETIEKMPISFFNVSYDEPDIIFSIEKLGITTIGDLKKYLNAFYGSEYWNPHDIDRIHFHLSELITSYKKEFYPKLSSYGSNHEKEFIHKVYLYFKLKNSDWDLSISLKHYQEIETLTQELFRERKNDFYESLLPEESIQKVNQIKEELHDHYLSLFELNEKLFKIINHSQDKALEDFWEDSASYYALLDSILGSSKPYRPNDLPGFVVDKVEKMQLDLKGLKGTLRPYQIFGAQYGLTFKKTLLGDEMGLGKTIQAIAMAQHLINNDQSYITVVLPLSVLINWKHEIEKWSDIPVFIFRGKNRYEAFQKWKSNGGIILLNYEQASHFETYLNNFSPDFLIVDEAHYIKNPKAKRTKLVSKIAFKCDYNLFMTGTPLENRVSEMKNLISILNRPLANKIDTKNIFYIIDDFKKEIAPVYLRRKRQEVLKELPDIETIEYWSNFSSVEQNFYDDAVRDGLSGLMKMRRAAFYGQSPENSEKIQHIIDICDEARENGDKVLIFSFFKIVLNELKNHLESHSVRLITGDVSTIDRQKLIDDFSHDESGSVLLSQIEAGGVGLNIQAANVVILCEPQWKPSTEQQAISRVYRMGQTKNVIVYRLLTEESIDETMMEVLDLKTQIFNAYARESVVSDAYDAKHLNRRELEKKVFQIEQNRLLEKSKAL